ncbi:hypothetical protein K431DRAFT_159841 [Polychaeton citri CBS 116435]|uniref:Bacteriocin-protection protein n=1 Tax=Polychaeton citri CBS 116435 TaxID=1314669 RepID=A0A9P4Q2V4_9PEZI|nr:hypothetical protein K431DRAFT_159841 [Polychaeton citri CBS 116435]
MPVELPELIVADASDWAKWLIGNGTASKGVWLSLAKKGTTTPTSLTYPQALDEALCHGWIDGQALKGDECTYQQRFTPRAVESAWSKRNVGIVARLDEEGRMRPAGRAAVEAAQADGRWERAYAGSSTAEPPEEFMSSIAGIPKAQATWNTLNKQNRYLIYYRLASLKTVAGREKRMQAFVDMLAQGNTPLPQKQAGIAGRNRPLTPLPAGTIEPPRRSSRTVRSSLREQSHK